MSFSVFRRAEGRPVWGNALLLVLFPALLVLSVEYNQLQSLRAMRTFFWSRPGVFLFDCFFVGTLYGLFLFTFRRGWIAALASGVPLFIISCVEFFKFDISGSHFVPQDMALVGKLTTVAGLARPRVTLPILITFFLLSASVFVLWWENASVSRKIPRRFFGGGACLFLAILTLATPLSGTVLAAFDVDTRAAGNLFVAEAKFTRNNMVAFWASELSRALTTGPAVPEAYEKETVEALLHRKTSGVKPETLPNVVFISSESFADFRRIGETVPPGTYDAFDRARREGFGGTAVVPTFGGYTVRSEFEMLHGLPVASLGDPLFPHKAVVRDEAGAFPALYRALGYTTVFLHPFSADFYNRNELYPHLGFEKLLFEEDLPVDGNRFRTYADDGLLYDTALSLLKEIEKPAFLFLNTMQNHQPYYDDSAPVTAESEFAYYLRGIAHSSERLNQLLDALTALDEPTLLVFVGDHYPFFGQDGSVYDERGFDETSCHTLFEQPFAVWANYDADFSAFSTLSGPVSLFYLPHLTLQTAAPGQANRFVSTMLSLLPQMPVYTTPYGTPPANRAALDLLTYDRTIGEGYSLQ